MSGASSVLGMELSAARARLEGEGFSLCEEELRPRKGFNGGEKRVIRVRSCENGTLALCWAWFQTALREQEEE